MPVWNPGGVTALTGASGKLVDYSTLVVGSTVQAGTPIIQNGFLYRRIATGTVSGTFSTASWQPIFAGAVTAQVGAPTSLEQGSLNLEQDSGGNVVAMWLGTTTLAAPTKVLDTHAPIIYGLLANRPTAASVSDGTVYFATDVGGGAAQVRAGSWVALTFPVPQSPLGNIALPIAAGATPWGSGTTAIGTANQARCSLWVPTKSGVLHDLTVYNGATVAGNVRVGVFDTGQATAGTYTVLYDSGSVAQAGASQNQVIADPSLSVVAGTPVMLALMTDSTTATFGKFPTAAPPAGAAASLPSAAFVGTVNSAKLIATIAFGSFAFANTVETSMVAATTGYFVMGRVA